MPMFRSMCHGGIWRATTRALIDFAQGRASWYVASDIGAIESVRWHVSHFAWKMGAMSLVKVGFLGASAAAAAAAVKNTAASAAAPTAHPRALCPLKPARPLKPAITSSFRTCRDQGPKKTDKI